MTDDERAAVAGLWRCTFLPGSWDKRFARALAQRDASKPLSDKQRDWLWRLVWKYRRQIPDARIVRVAQRYIDPQEAEQLTFVVEEPL
jgi:hypothetical protein